jgi:decaprenyl-phosphate phosphoribosyltransferase
VPPPRNLLTGVVSAIRPRQWVKNGLVIIAPAAAGQMTSGATLRHTAGAFLAFSLAASGLYLINDVRDRFADRLHPTKKFRAIASGVLPVSLALVLAVLLLGGAMISSWFVGTSGRGLVYVLATYIALTLAYSVVLKRQPVIEFAIVASGFFLRALGGAVASDLYVSSWFLAVTAFAALFLVIGKRTAEIKELGVTASDHRAVLAAYTPDFLRSALTLVASAVVTTYCLWAFDVSPTGLSNVHHRVVLVRLTAVPVVIAMLHILRRLERGDGGAPEDLVFSDHTLQALGLLWAALFVLGVHT